MFWVSVFGAVLADAYTKTDSSEFMLASGGILAGILLHDIGLLPLISLTRKVMNRTMIKGTFIIAGILLLGFGCYFFYEFYTGIKGYF